MIDANKIVPYLTAIVLGVGLALQFTSAVWIISGLFSRVNASEISIERLSARQDIAEKIINVVSNDAARTSAKIDGIKESLDRLLDRKNDAGK